MYESAVMRTTLAASLVLALAVPVHAGSDPSNTARAPRSDGAPKPSLDRPATAPAKPIDGKSLCTYVNPDQNAPSDRTDCIAGREPTPQRPTEKTPPGPPGNDAMPSSASR